ncbi:unnamed protein product [Zymoseptoria tritici ST99CH_1E4]|uniref:Uncharacterized protein n=1 Tax=Zymoseptoria tritici ST99CH_1E4 TaxID=1276532 RepID=A0A2H1G4I3_ZYMTR|nr:unnamed protein product [Zymoseptoria tritici ST99CH_1E4]
MPSGPTVSISKTTTHIVADGINMAEPAPNLRSFSVVAAMSANPIVMLVAAIHSVAAFTTARLSKINKPRMPGFLRRRSSLALSVSNLQELDKSQRLVVLTDEIQQIRASRSRNQHQQRLRRLRVTRHRKAAPVPESSASPSLPFTTDIISEAMGLEDEEEEGGPVGSPVDWSRMPSRSAASSTKRECTWSESPLDHSYPPYPAASATSISPSAGDSSQASIFRGRIFSCTTSISSSAGDAYKFGNSGTASNSWKPEHTDWSNTFHGIYAQKQRP